MYADQYVPNLDAIAGAPGADLPGAVRTAGPKIADPTIWIVVLAAVWIGLVRFGIGVRVGK